MRINQVNCYTAPKQSFKGIITQGEQEKYTSSWLGKVTNNVYYYHPFSDDTQDTVDTEITRARDSLPDKRTSDGCEKSSIRMAETLPMTKKEFNSLDSYEKQNVRRQTTEQDRQKDIWNRKNADEIIDEFASSRDNKYLFKKILERLFKLEESVEKACHITLTQ